MKTFIQAHGVALTAVRGLAAAMLLALLTVAGMTSQIFAWPVNLDSGEGSDMAYDVVIDGAGNVIAVGQLGDQSAVTKRESSAGGEIWTTLVTGEVRDVAVDVNGDVYAGGGWGSPTGGWVVRLDGATGNVVWHRFLGKPDIVWDLELDSAGDVFVTGWSTASFSQGAGDHLAVIKLDGATGGSLWERFIVGGLGTVGYWWWPASNAGWVLEVDPAGDVVATGALAVSYADQNKANNFAVVKLDGASGVELWRYAPESYAGTGYSIGMDAAGDVFAAGVHSDGPPPFTTVVKLSGSTGQELWAWEWTYSGWGLKATDLEVTSTGNVAVCGIVELQYEYGVALVDGATGGTIWHTSFLSPQWIGRNPWGDWPVLVLDSGDDIYLAGLHAFNVDGLYVEKLSGASGALLWTKVFAGSDSPGAKEVGLGLALDPAGSLYVAGTLHNQGTGNDFTLIRTGVEATFVCPWWFCRVGVPELIPIWEDEIGWDWVLGYEDPEELLATLEEALAVDPELEDAVLTSDPEDLLLYPEQIVLLVPQDEVEAVYWMSENRDAIYTGRSAQSVLFLLSGGTGEQVLYELIAEGAWGPP